MWKILQFGDTGGRPTSTFMWCGATFPARDRRSLVNELITSCRTPILFVVYYSQ